MLNKEEYEKIIETLTKSFEVEVTGGIELYEGTGFWGINTDMPAVITADDDKLTDGVELIPLQRDYFVTLENFSVFYSEQGHFVAYDQARYLGEVKVNED